MRQNWKNLSFDFQEVQSVSEDPAPLTLQPQEELEDLERYIQGVWWKKLRLRPSTQFKFIRKPIVSLSTLSTYLSRLLLQIFY